MRICLAALALISSQSPPEEFTTAGADISSSNALAIWIDSGVVKASFFSEGDFGPVTTLSTNTDDSGKDLAIWVLNPMGEIKTISIEQESSPPSPPASIEGKAKNNKSATQIDHVHIIKFKPSTDTSVVFYRLRRNGKIIAEIPKKGPFEYIDHNRCRKTDVYTLTSVNAVGIESSPLVVELS